MMEQKTEDAIARCWHEEDGFFYGIDTRTAMMIRKPGIAGLLPLFADAAVAARHPRLVQRLENWLARVAYGVLSFEPGRPEFEPQRYWRGPSASFFLATLSATFLLTVKMPTHYLLEDQ